MSLVERVISLSEQAPLPDALTKAGIYLLVDRSRRQRASTSAEISRRFAEDMANFPVALATDAANAQHYEIPAEFFALFLGRYRKYSSAYYANATTTLDGAEKIALGLTAEHAGLEDGQSILELGCGWGSLTLWMGEHFPMARITAVSNSNSQRAAIMAAAAARGLSNINVVTADMNDFDTTETFDRIVSVEMFEHMSNWRPLLENAKRWLKPDGRFFMHIFTHRTMPYRFDHTDRTDWIGQHFFTGGIMPSQDLIRQFPDLFEVEKEWRWSGEHYRRTAADWLRNFDRNAARIEPILQRVYGADARLWKRRWRLFFLATMGLFGHADGDEWGVNHYRLKPSAA
ncbi:MAG: cyclopropane-fatty-acyl-phospholipid synthase family protein [Alphaproteobacteria bacterium]|nr:cyclopropane-fatty-acyl-phospholipid synthase family protein [Alphaproteobacteria bacterium]